MLQEHQTLQVRPYRHGNIQFILTTNWDPNKPVTVEVVAEPNDMTEQGITNVIESLLRTTKRISFGILYGIGAKKLAENLTGSSAD